MTHTLTIVGLGPGDPSLRSIAAQQALDSATMIVLRTAIHPGIDDFIDDPRVSSCDDLYVVMPNFQTLYQAVVDRVVGLLETEDIVYAVPGNPVAGELTVISLRSALQGGGHEVVVIPGTGGLDIIAATTGLDLMSDGVQTLDALDIRDWVDRAPFNGSLLDINPIRPLVITQIYKRSIAAAVKIALITVYPDEHEISIIGWDGQAGINVAQLIPLHKLDRMSVDHLTSIVVPPLDWRANTHSPFELFRITARLRDVDGCPWDREQTHASIRGAVIEEAFEVADAIDNNNPAELLDELGDLLLQAALHAQIANEADEFDIADVFDAVSRKLIRRHPHVFGDAVANDPEAVIRTWETVKATEPGNETANGRDPLEKLPKSMPLSIKLGQLEEPDGSTLTSDEQNRIAQEITERLLRLVHAGTNPEPLLDAAYRILRR